MRLLSRLIVALALCLIAIALPAAPARAAPCVPWDIELSPEYGPPGTEVEVYGHGFEASELVDIRYDSILVSEGTETGPGGDFRIIIRVPEDCAGQYEVSAVVGSDLGPVERHHYFTVKPGLTVSPENGPAGTTVAVEGKGFAKDEDGIQLLYYYLDSGYETVESNIRANSKGGWQTSFQVPLSTRGKHKIDAQGAVSHLHDVQDATFTVTSEISLDESSGFVGDTLVMTGSRFAVREKGITILFDDEPMVTDIQANSQGEWEASFEVPEVPTGEHSVTAEGEQTSKEDVGDLSFEIEPDIVLSPTRGHVGTNVTVTGHGFAASEELMITYGDIRVATPAANEKGTFDASFPAPESSHGEHKVTVGTVGENHANAMFIMESDPPGTPTPTSPSNGSRLGLAGNVTPTFQWSGVSDDSGVRYSLQISASDTVTGTGEFADPIVSVPDLVGTNYTLDETEALSQGTYYWIVQAVDGAENEGHWSTAHSFRVGLLPGWAFIAIIVAAVVVVGALVLAIIRRRGIYYDRW